MLNPLAVEKIAQACGLITWDSFTRAGGSQAKVVYILGGWRGGKSARIAFILMCRIMVKYLHTPGTHLFWLVGPDYEQARPEYFYLSRWCSTLGLQVTASSAIQGSLRMEIQAPGLPGLIEVVTKSATDPTSLGSVAPVEIAMCEAGQMTEDADMWVLGRTAEKNANVIKGGTFENEEGKAQFAWFEQQAQEVLDTPSERREAFKCPTWENAYLYGDCRAMIADDPSLAGWCPDDQHGPLHSGLDHPMIRQLKDQFKDRPIDWAKRFGGEPTGIRNPVYEWAIHRPDFYLRPMPPELGTATFGRNSIWQYTAGGIDPGLVHPAALTVGSIVASGPYKGQTWVRGGIHDLSGSANSMWQAKDFLQKRYGVSMWGGDPVGLQYTREFENIEAMRGELYSRMARVKIVNGVAADDMLFFDSNDPYVRLLFSQLQRIHKRKDSSGQLVYDRREDDDMVASFEDMMAMLHGQPIIQPMRSFNLRRGRTPVWKR